MVIKNMPSKVQFTDARILLEVAVTHAYGVTNSTTEGKSEYHAEKMAAHLEMAVQALGFEMTPRLEGKGARE